MALALSPTAVSTVPSGGVLQRVLPDSVAARAGLLPGDLLHSIDGHVLRDIIDYQFYAVGTRLELGLRRGEEDWLLVVEKEEYEPLGVDFGVTTFDGITQCKNHCPFCFVDRMPKGQRRSLYIRDDDYRYSFLFANFVTLTNLSEADWQRIEEQRLSPLYVSVHATDLDLRRRLLGNPTAPDILDQIARLARMRIQIYTQLVLCPGVNDGEHLDRSVRDLAAAYPTVQSVAAVPVGLARPRVPGRTERAVAGGGALRPFRDDEARDVVARVGRWQRSCRRRLGISFVYAADELYLAGGTPVPGRKSYDGFPQIEDGIGLTRQFIDDWARLRRRGLPPVSRPTRIVLVCGRLVQPLMERAAADLARLSGARVEVIAVENRFFGGNVTVSGLLAGQDVLAALAGIEADLVAIPRAMLDYQGERCLDGVTLAELEAALHPARVAPALRLSELRTLLG